MLTEYFELFSALDCCYADVHPYLHLLGEQQQAEVSLCVCVSLHISVRKTDVQFLRLMSAVTGLPYTLDVAADGCSAPHDYAQTLPQLRRHITCLRLARKMGVHTALAVNDKLVLARQLLHRYQQAADMFGA